VLGIVELLARPARRCQRLADPSGRADVVRIELVATTAGQRGPTDRMEQGQAGARSADPSQLAQAVNRIRQMGQQAGREDRIDRSSREWQPDRVSKHEESHRGAATPQRFREHLCGDVNCKHLARLADRGAKPRDGSAGPTRDIDDHATRRGRQLGDRLPKAEVVVGKPILPTSRSLAEEQPGRRDLCAPITVGWAGHASVSTPRSYADVTVTPIWRQ
jgi:hypothetical protein